MAVVKANAYGHSASIVAPALEKNGADAFAVSNIDEALALREYGITSPVLILGYTPCDMADTLVKNNISQCVFSPEYAKALSKSAVKSGKTVKIHIKLDTGMSRIGFDCRDESLCGISDAIAAARLDNFELEGIFTHFAVSDRDLSADDGFTDMQYRLFCDGVKRFENEGLHPKIKHCCNSAAFFCDREKQLDMSRAGIVLYGLSPSGRAQDYPDLIPVMSVKSVISMVKTVKRGTTVSYGRTFTAERDMKLATVTTGYADGYPRALSNKGCVLIGGKRADIVGRICMDQFTVDVTGIENVKQGDEVLLFGKELSVDLLADICGTINYEIICGVSPRVIRVETKTDGR